MRIFLSRANMKKVGNGVNRLKDWRRVRNGAQQLWSSFPRYYVYDFVFIFTVKFQDVIIHFMAFADALARLDSLRRDQRFHGKRRQVYLIWKSCVLSWKEISKENSKKENWSLVYYAAETRSHITRREKNAGFRRFARTLWDTTRRVLEVAGLCRTCEYLFWEQINCSPTWKRIIRREITSSYRASSSCSRKNS